jgi:aminomethyltransferase
MKKTILYEKHIAQNAKMSPFGGYEMPIQYEGIIKEHQAVRNNVGMFDTCHMGEFIICGESAVADLEKIVSCQVATIKQGQCKYGFICNEAGGVIDDQILYRQGETEFMMVVNASTEPNDFKWIKEHLSTSTEIINVTETTAKLDVQGPNSLKILSKLLKEPIVSLPYYTFMNNFYQDEKIIVSRTGYTGELGYEVYCSTELILILWDELLNAGVIPAGLGARDTLRLEMGYPLYGHELDENTNACESGFNKAIGTKAFIGSGNVTNSALKKNLLTGFLLDGRRSARHGDTILDTAGKLIGRVTSGSFCPSLNAACALGYIPASVSQEGFRVIIKTERSEIPATVTTLPFYKDATGRKKTSDFI